MRTARQAQWAQLFELPDQPALPLQARLRAAIVREVLSGRLPAGLALPSSRDLARDLGLSRNTVTAAYLQLIDDGYLESRPRSGVFVAARAQPPAVAASRTRAAAADEAAPRPLAWARRLQHPGGPGPALAKPLQWRDYPYPFVYGTHDPQLFPIEDFRECCVRSLARAQAPNWSPDFDTDDVPELIEQLRTQVLPQRGVYALPDEILITSGAQQAYFLLAEALFNTGSRVGLEEPGHPHARNSFALRGPALLPVAVDDEGVVVDRLPALDYLFVTPSHQSPTTATLSLARRQALLALAVQRDFVLIEDDYEAENLYEGKPMPALKSLDRDGRVIYIGSLSKQLSPALRLGYIVAPAELVAALRGLRHAMLRHPSTFLQQAYALFVSLGHHESHARRVNAAMRERLQCATEALQRHLPDLAFARPLGGASLWLRAPDWADSRDLALIARRHGVLFEAGHDFFAAPPPGPCPYLRLRLSSIAPADIEPGIAALARALDELAVARGQARTAASRAAPLLRRVQ